jgi:putative hydrolase of the HAD superfamily
MREGSKNMIKAVIFDIGHTLVHYKNPLNWKSLYEPALKNVARLCDYQLTEKNYADAISILCEYNTRINPREKEVSADLIWNRILNSWGKEISDLLICKEAFYSFFRNDCFVYADVFEFLVYLRARNIKTATLSDVPYGMENKYALEDIASIIEYIDLPYTSNDIGYRKPNVKGLQTIAQELEVLVQEVMYIGDEEKDIICANNAGVVSVLIDREAKGLEYGQHYSVKDLNELKAIL